MTQYRMLVDISALPNKVKVKRVRGIKSDLTYFDFIWQYTNVYQHPVLGHVRSPFIPLTSSASFLDLYLEFDDSGQLSTKIYDKRDDFNFKIINIPASPA
jgi:hypothetical protein